MKQKMNELLWRLKKFTWIVQIKVIEEYEMIWNVIVESRQTINAYFVSVERRELSLLSNIPITDAPDKRQILSLSQKMC